LNQKVLLFSKAKKQNRNLLRTVAINKKTKGENIAVFGLLLTTK
jgi:hypothetical protein